MNSGFFKKISIFLKAINLFDNWYLYPLVYFKITKKEHVIFKTKTGLKIKIRVNSTDLMALTHVWMIQEYSEDNFSDNGYLFISSGDRQKFDPAQNMKANLGKIIRLHDDGSIPSDNPFIEHGGITSQIWSLGHRNPLGIAFDENGQLWNIEMGPEGGDELNRVVRGENYGYPIVSNGDHYDGRDIPDHPTRPEFTPPKTWWSPVISPSAFIIYSGDLFANWKGMGFITGLSSESLVRIEFNGENAHEAERFDMGGRIRSIRQGPNGGIWILEDGRNSNKSRLLKLVPRQEKSIH